MLLGLSNILAAVIAFMAWPWWIATTVGLLAGFQHSSVRIYNSPWRDRIEADDPAVSKAFIGSLAWGALVGAAFATAIYFLVRYLMGLA